MIKIQKLKRGKIVSIFIILGFSLIFTSKLNHFKSLGEQGLYFEPLIPFSGSATFIDQNIATDTIWGIDESPYYICDNILINQGVKLTIEPGVEVLFNGTYTITVEGTLNATGTRNNPIVFTSNASIPAKSDWGSIYFKNTSSDIDSTIKYSEISYSDNGVRLEDAFPEISNCKFFNNTNGVYLYIMNEEVERNIPSIENSTFYHNDYGINVNRLDWGVILPELDIRLMNNKIFENENGIYFEFIDDLGSITFLNNTIFNNTNNGLYFNRIEDITNNMTFIKNNISFNSNYGLFFNIHGFGFITNLLLIENTINNNSNHGLAFNGEASDITSLTFEKNQIFNNQNDGIYLTDWSEPNRIYNNSIFNNANYNIECLWNAATLKINATHNWWGTNNYSEIEQKLFDYNDNSNYAEIIYTPFLNYTPILSTPILNVIEGPSITGNVTLSWNEVTQADSYKLYRSDSLIMDLSGMEPIVSSLEDTTYVDENLLDGTYYYVVIATSYSGDSPTSNCQSVVVNKDTVVPTINIVLPYPDQLFGQNSPSFIVEVYDLNLDTMWYTIDGGLTNITFTTNGTIDQNNWTAHPDGLVTIIFYANDSLGHINSSQVNVSKDTTSPSIDIISPTQYQLFGVTVPGFNVEIFDQNLDIMWYTIDNGLNNFTFASNETINQASWTASPEGMITIKFYANDSLGNVYSAEITVKKDTEAPIVSIIDPSTNDVFEFAPAYEITITELNLDTIWYTIDGGENNFTVSGITGIVNQELWDSLPNGYVTVRFYANDTLGQLNFDEVIIIKDAPTPKSKIPGYDLFILLGIISLVTVIRIKLKFHKKIK